jgi:hypothetical protein
MTTQASVQRATLAEPVVVAEFWANRRGARGGSGRRIVPRVTFVIYAKP